MRHQGRVSLLLHSRPRHLADLVLNSALANTANENTHLDVCWGGGGGDAPLDLRLVPPLMVIQDVDALAHLKVRPPRG